MADNTTINNWSGGDTISTDDLTTVNDGTVSGVKVQRMKIGYGDDASLRDASTLYPLPVNDSTLISLLQIQIGWLRRISLQLAIMNSSNEAMSDLSPLMESEIQGR